MQKIEQLLVAIKSGELEKFSFIIEEFQQQIFTYCYYMLGHYQEAEDAAQNVFLKAFEHLDSYHELKNFSAWLYKIAHNHCVNLLKRKKVINFITYKRDMLNGHNYVENEIDKKELKLTLYKALKILPPEEQSLLVLRIIEEKRYQEIAELLGIKPATLRKKYQRALEKLRKYLIKGRESENEFSYI